ncbi:MAG: hypothetical protein RMM17_11605 [Acidobacteriota bacterium]|nr:hypothetical protein [Blastocatellia bacterium]MDW8413318.1 hypothetical protein [Acidobacteriota bacterium]
MKQQITTFLRGLPLIVLYGIWTAIFIPLCYWLLSIPEADFTTIVISALIFTACMLSFFSLQGTTIYWLGCAAEGQAKLNSVFLKGMLRSLFVDGAKVALLAVLMAPTFWLAMTLFPVTSPTPNADALLKQPLTGQVKVEEKASSRTQYPIEIVRSALLWFALPLLLLRLWSEAVLNGLDRAFKSLLGSAWNAWHPSMLLWAILPLLLVLGAPVLLFSIELKVENAYLALLLFTIKLATAWLLLVLGWLFAVTLTVTSVKTQF